MSGARFLRHLLGWSGGLAAALYAFILVLDPYQNVPFSPPLARAPVSQNQRYAYPALARDPAFESVVIGTSTARLLDPARLGALLGTPMANLAMNSATAYEQARLFEVFRRAHPAMRHLVLGLDETWCNRGPHIERYTFRDFPEWMYDDDRWNDLLYLFNDKALENAVRMAELLLGARAPKYRPDGYADFTLDFGPWDAETVAARLYAGGPRDYPDADLAPRDDQPAWTYPLLPQLRSMIASLPRGARATLVFLPLHGRYIANAAANMRVCKARIAGLLAPADNAAVLDYFHLDALTRNDANYWDPVHFTNAVARLVETDIAAVASDRPPPSGHARLLLPIPAAR
jgi:hypothetical protein